MKGRSPVCEWVREFEMYMGADMCLQISGLAEVFLTIGIRTHVLLRFFASPYLLFSASLTPPAELPRFAFFTHLVDYLIIKDKQRASA